MEEGGERKRVAVVGEIHRVGSTLAARDPDGSSVNPRGHVTSIFGCNKSQIHGQLFNNRVTHDVNSRPFVQRVTLDRNSYMDSFILFVLSLIVSR